MDLNKKSLAQHKKHKGKIEIKNKVPLATQEDLSLYYTPGVAEPCRQILKSPEKINDYTNYSNTIAIITDGSAILGLGNIGARAGLPVMEGKANLFKKFANIDAYPILLDTQDPKEIIETVMHIAPGFAGINLEDIAAPKCIEIEKELDKKLDIPVFHDDQHGTAIAVMAGLENSLKLAHKKWSDIKIVINGAGSAGMAIATLLSEKKPKDIILVDKFGILCHKNDLEMNPYQHKCLKFTNQNNKEGQLKAALKSADIFIGVSAPNILKPEWIKLMNKKPIIFAMANPDPEILPAKAKKAGAFIVATGRSDYPNQINNALVFPGLFRAALDYKFVCIDTQDKLKCASAIANTISKPALNKIVPTLDDKNLLPNILKYLK